jgi:hypothetical protein
MFAKGSFMFSDEHAVNDNANAIVKPFDDRVAPSEPRWTEYRFVS